MNIYISKLLLISTIFTTINAANSIKTYWSTDLRKTMLGWHAESKKFDELIANGADINALSQRGETPLTTAIAWGHTREALILIEKGAIIDPAWIEHASSNVAQKMKEAYFKQTGIVIV